jgi:hypothetical protein
MNTFGPQYCTTNVELCQKLRSYKAENDQYLQLCVFDAESVAMRWCADDGDAA